MLFFNYINSSGHSGSSNINHKVNVEEDPSAILLTKLDKNSISLPPLLHFCLNLYKII